MTQQLLSQGTGAMNSQVVQCSKNPVGGGFPPFLHPLRLPFALGHLFLLQDATGRTPLFWATEYRHERLVELLLSHGADPDVRDKEGNLCLHRAAYFGSPTIARMLLEAGSDLNATNHLGNSPLHLAAQEKCHECLSLFLACGAVSLKNKAGQLPQQCTQLSSPSCRALQAFSAQLPSQVEQILSRDISRGFEQVAVPCLNMVDQESCPRDFLYITGNILSGSELLPTKTWDQSQGCRCDGGCTVASCPCILRSQCSWTLTGGQLRLDTTGTAPEMGSIYECSMLCACPRSCPNRVVQRGLRTQLQLYRTAAKGWGVRTVQDVPHGAFLCQYFGELISNTEAAHREEDTYYFVVDMQDGQQCCLDGRYYGNVGRFLNHSCQPNLVALQVALGYDIPGIAFFSTRAIQAGEELGFDYGDQFWEVKSWNCTCLCGFPGCRRLARSSARLPSPAAGDPGSGPSSPCPSRPPLRGFALKTKRSSPLKRVTRSRLARESRPP
ncbi:histone-lysine N-methyltransferase EHMT1-like isoform X1 [Pituophis catenifer annectens]|uniref:histone-lysine N-methyltransferase EHMT1-like isoform X1 n=1 Tax=Pituophis catenifer annectens TaxID=94852 RepID=UPI003996832D